MSLKEKYEKISNSIEYQQFLLDKEILEKNSKNDYDYLYPTLNDPEFNVKISEKKEFQDMKYDGSIEDPIEKAEKLCNAEFELAPHQLFVRNFLSFNTPYNSLLLYHGLGTGKTCSAITICEEMRDYMRQMGISQRIIIVASPSVQENFKLQLFDERKLKKINGVWNIHACTGNKYLKEINPTNIKGLSKEKVMRQINRIINIYYLFMGYTEFSNYIVKKSMVDSEGLTQKKVDLLRKKKLKKVFERRLIVIDEVHNIRISDDNKNKQIAKNLMQLVKNIDGIRLLLLSATPMYNSYKEIIWLLNLMNANDRRAQISVKEVFDKTGNFIINDRGEEIGKELLIQKAIGYVSFIRGENPYTFPYRIFPKIFEVEKSITQIKYPEFALNGRSIIQQIEHLDLYCVGIGDYQLKVYNYILKHIKDNLDDKIEFENMERFGYTLLQYPLEALNMTYPIDKIDDDDLKVNPSALVGNAGLKRIMSFKETTKPPQRFDFEYREDILKKYGRIFSQSEIGKYSSKIKNICSKIQESDGIVLIYSQYIDGGLVPIALALEEMGFQRYGQTKSLLKSNSKNKDALKYAMITGDKLLSPDNLSEIKAVTDESNANGEKVKVVFISKAGSEGLDFKNIRQIHILEPWYNTNRIEQIIGRGVRTCSHKNLSFEKRNVMIFLYGTMLPSELEAADMYVYRLADLKATQIGVVSRVLKQNAIDCLLNHSQTNFTEQKMDMEVELELSNKLKIKYKIGDKPFSAACDYMETCDYTCRLSKNIDTTSLDTYNLSYLMVNNDRIVKRIKGIFKERYFYKANDLISEINVLREYPTMQIYAALNQIINDENEFLVDRYQRTGKLVNIGDFYFFQPIEIESKEISIHDRVNPIDFKRPSIRIPLKKTFGEIKIVKSDKTIIDTIKDLYEVVFTKKEHSDKNNWYSHCFAIIELILSHESNSTVEIFHDLVIAHIIESLMFNDKLKLLNYIYFKSNLDLFEEKVKTYFDNHIIKNSQLVGIFLLKDNKYKLYILKETTWSESEQEDLKDLSGVIKKNIDYLLKTEEKNDDKYENLGQYLGYMSSFKNTGMVFKIKDTTSKRKKGARCDQSGKGNVINIINIVTGEERLTRENTEHLNILKLCIYEEMLLRYYNSIKENNKVWFLTPEEAVIISI